jgi:hypothetical protein
MTSTSSDEASQPLIVDRRLFHESHCGRLNGEQVARGALVKRRLLGLLVGATALFAIAAPASAQYPPPVGFIIDPSTIPAFTSTTVYIEGLGCPRASTASIFIVVDGEEVFLGSTPVDDDAEGGFRANVTIPPLPPGEYVVLVRCGNLVLSSILTVVGDSPTTVTPPTSSIPTSSTSAQSTPAQSTPAAGPLPRTGSDPWALVRIALLLLAAGGLLALQARKRRQSYG